MNDGVIHPDWPAPSSIIAFTTTRNLPASADAAALLPAGFELPRLRQVHGKRVVEADVAAGAEADAVISRRAGMACTVATADCLPLLLCNRAGDECAAVHAGWRGLAAGIIEATVAQFNSDPSELLAWLGPAISAACYEVGGEVRAQMLAAVDGDLQEATDSCFEPCGKDKYLADLPALARAQLAHLGCDTICGGSDCSYSDAARFHSFRRDGEASGRMLSVIAISR